MNLGEILKKARESKDLTLTKAGVQLGLGKVKLHRIETYNPNCPKVELSPELLDKLAKFYEISYDVLTMAAGFLPPDVKEKLFANPELINIIRELDV